MIKRAIALLAASFAFSCAVFAQEAGEKAIVNMASAETARRFVSTEKSVSIAPATNPPGVAVKIEQGPTAYPGLELKAENGLFDFSAAGYVEARVTNTGTQSLVVNLRLDNDNGRGAYWITDKAKLAPGQVGKIRAYLSRPVNGFEANKITRVYFFTLVMKDGPGTFRIDSLVTGGKPGDLWPEAAAEMRVLPPGGVLFANGVNVDAARQITVKGGATGTVQNGTFQASLPASAGADAVVNFKPAVGTWDLRDALQVRVKVKNTGTGDVTPQLHLDSTYGPTDTVPATTPLKPGQEAEIVIPFTAHKPWKHTPQQEAAGANTNVSAELQGPFAAQKNAAMWGPEPGSGSKFISNAVQSVGIGALPIGQDRSLSITSIKADMPPALVLPDWVGKRPPVDGDWVKTFDDDFSEASIDTARWNITGGQWYDKITHYTKDNLILGKGLLRIRYSKQTGHHNDDPKEFQTDYAAGFIDTMDKWRQRYGYFECRMKLPTAPGLWAAFWMMPNRPGTGRPGVRGSTADGGMEFDIVEWLSVWGPNRYNIAMHWDNYQADHKSAGSKIFFQPDKDGFVDAGLLWTPGSAIYYANGKEVMRFESPRVSNVPSNLIVYMVTGGWDGNHLDMANPRLPDDYVIDYVRCWQRRDLASEVDTTQAGR